MDFEIQIHIRNRPYYFKCLAMIIIGAVVFLYGALTLPQSLPQQNQLTYYTLTTSEQQQTDLRNYQIASVSFKIIIGGIGIILLGLILVCKKWRATHTVIERIYRNRQIVPEEIIGNNKTNVKQLKNRPLTIQQQPTPIQKQPQEIQKQHVPRQVSPLKVPTYRNPYTNPYPARYYQVSQPVQIPYDNYV